MVTSSRSCLVDTCTLSMWMWPPSLWAAVRFLQNNWWKKERLEDDIYVYYLRTRWLLSLVALKAFHHEAPFSHHNDIGVSYRVPWSPGDLDRIKKRIALRVALFVYSEVECGVWQVDLVETDGTKLAKLGTCWTIVELELNRLESWI